MAEKTRAERRRGKREIRLSTFPQLMKGKWPSKVKDGPFTWPAGKPKA